MAKPKTTDTTAPTDAKIEVRQPMRDAEWYWSIGPTGRRRKVQRKAKR